MKKFLIIGNMGAVTYKEVFPHIKEGEMTFGINHLNTFVKPDRTTQKFGNIEWFTNLNKTVFKTLSLTKQYNPSEYPKFDNYDAINVDRLKDIPYDYDGTIGVPITILQYLNSDGTIDVQFELMGLWTDKRNENPIFIKGNETYLDDKHKRFVGPVIDSKSKYARIIIKKKVQDSWKDESSQRPI